MSKLCLALALAAVLAALQGQESPARPPAGAAVAAGAADAAPRFSSVDIYADSLGKGLAAYQIEILADPARSALVGVEGGDSQPSAKFFAEPPYYDPSALHDSGGGRVILAALTTEPNPPTGKVRVARLHFRETGEGTPELSARLMAAAGPGGERIEVKIEVFRQGGSR